MISPFLNSDRIIENEYAFAIYDSYPVTKGHSLVIPKRQIKEIFELNKEEYESCFELVRKVKPILDINLFAIKFGSYLLKNYQILD